ncbi:hypothetical protein [Bifidobacterium myosotis]|uniref:Uridine kinase n=1 Tax=Bifidobacterium myosotis TaxID=1630166 RepID=A0A5M9ZKA2_9BIFI|nr:hypothetical protein [Bifidobacterium myosotis]KAA8828036.1 hypothetical protein EMO91_06220 [Bifidobacterium myosotis]
MNTGNRFASNNATADESQALTAGRDGRGARPFRTLLAVAAAVTCLIGLAACSVTGAGDGGTDPEASGGPTPGTDVSAPAGTSSDGMDADPAANLTTAELETIAKRFTACLVEKGFDAKVVESSALAPSGSLESAPKTTVVVRRLGADGAPIIPGPGTQISGDSDPLYPDVMYTIVSEQEGAWVGFRNSKALAGSIYGDKQADYAACEQANPDFAQPNYAKSGSTAGGSSSGTTDSDAQQILIDFARQARADGFGWMTDPSPGEDKIVEIPSDISYQELRRFFDTYSGDKWPTHDGIPFGVGCTGECEAYSRISDERLS